MLGCYEFIDLFENYQIPFIRDTVWISLSADSDQELNDSTVYIYGYREPTSTPNNTIPRYRGDIEIIAIFSERPEADGKAILNPKKCLWVWHSDMGGTTGLVSFSQGRPVEEGVVLYGEEPALPFSADFFIEPDLEPDQTGIAAVYVVVYYRDAAGAITHSSSYLQLEAAIAE